MTIDGRRGARIVNLAWQGNQMLLEANPAIPNFGSTFWTAPQSRWGWPPPAALHFDPYRATRAGDSLTLTGTIGEESRYQAIKTIRYDTTAEAFTLRYTLINHADTARAVGPWEVTVVPAGGITFFGEHPIASPLPSSTLSFSDTLGVRFLRYPPADTIPVKQKIFDFEQGGWLAHVTDDGLLLIKQFASVPADSVAPGQGKVEIFVNIQSGYLELENHGAYQTLEPGERMLYRVRWFLRKLPEGIPNDHISPALISLVQVLVKS